MMNLSAEMMRFGVSNADIQQLLSCSDKTVKNKLTGMTEFTVSEAMQIQRTFFPGLRMEYLFASVNVDKEVGGGINETLRL